MNGSHESERSVSSDTEQRVEEVIVPKSTIIQTDKDAKDGQNKCPKCGATEITINSMTGKLRCEFCGYEFELKKVEGIVTELDKLEGQVFGSGAQDIIADTKDAVTLKCNSCGADVVIDTSSVSQARCHWCRNVLSLNQQIPNGSITICDYKGISTKGN